ncbi:phosphatase PAP2 family protein [Sphingomonas sabuli]|uniref:Phosphatase PAP2 family protein n=1 Tax=Sphingomonas sabuli TaxID=2764186 RepID=A0A7G9L4R7_9SPHN|nr:phosphatase PAP2 family protein [Sphingomonas sabuli]QNM83616.1 phosphatase PAP2 family protein [Sphingomonas sabuli]
MWASARRELIWCGPLAGLTAIGFLCALWITAGTGVSAADIVLEYSKATALLGILALCGAAAVLTLVFAIRRDPTPLKTMGKVAGAHMRSPTLVAASLIGTACTIVLMGAFGAMKMLLPLYREFDWDGAFARADRMLLGGVAPWEITHGIFATTAATRVLDAIYTLWVPLLFFAVIVAACSSPVKRARFLLSFGAAWLILGVAGAYGLASAGPCYALSIGADGGADFQPLMDRLRGAGSGASPLNAVMWQSTLWNAHVTENYGFAMGISAMPSMHNAITMLYALALWNGRPLYRYGTALYALIILVASVHLGWHYLVDGLVAWAGMAAIWWAAGAYLRRAGYAAADQAIGEPSAEPASAPALA